MMSVDGGSRPLTSNRAARSPPPLFRIFSNLQSTIYRCAARRLSSTPCTDKALWQQAHQSSLTITPKQRKKWSCLVHSPGHKNFAGRPAPSGMHTYGTPHRKLVLSASATLSPVDLPHPSASRSPSWRIHLSPSTSVRVSLSRLTAILLMRACTGSFEPVSDLRAKRSPCRARRFRAERRLPYASFFFSSKE